jgi:glutathione S-transferase
MMTIPDPVVTPAAKASGPREGETTSTPAWKAINPKGRVPALLGVPGRNGGAENLLTEVPVILMYLARMNPAAKVLPSDPTAEAGCIEWMSWPSSDVHSMAFAQMWRAQRFTTDEEGFAAVRNRGRENVSECFAYIEKLLADGRGWAIPEGYTVVDAYLLVFYYWGRCRIRLDMGTLCPAWTRLSERVAERPAVQRALKIEGITIFESE